MNNYYDKIVELCKELLRDWDDCGDRKKVIMNNRAMNRLWKLDEKMNNDDGKNVLLKLLNHENDRVVLTAAMLCIKMNFNVEETLKKIEYIKCNSQQSLLRHEAEMMLYNNSHHE